MHFLILIKYLLFCLNYISISTYILNKISLKNANESLLFVNFNIFLDKSFNKNFDSKRIYDWYRLLSISIKLIFFISPLVI
jgi:hypothetical protein